MLKKISCFIGFLLIAALVSLLFLPWKQYAHDIIAQELKKHHIEAEFTVENIFPGTLVLKDITIKGAPITFDLLEVHYSARELIAKWLHIESIVLRSKDGEFSAREIRADLFRPNDVVFTVDISKVPLALVMNMVSGGKASAQGTVSGTLPITISKDGVVTIKEGTLSAGESGTLQVSPDAIPGDNEQVGLVRSALSDFHYQDFSMQINSLQDEKLSILLQLRGNNPNVYNGREIKLNVRLQGDLVDVFQQSVRSISNPETLLEKRDGQ